MLEKLTKIFGLMALLLVLGHASLAQNTKGDKPQSGRESRFRKSDKKIKIFSKKDRRTSDLRKYKPRKKGRGGERAGAPTRYQRVQPRHAGSPRGEYSSYRRSASGGVIRETTKPQKNHNLYPQHGRFVNNPSKKPRDSERPVSNRKEVARIKKIQSQPSAPPKNRVKTRSASRSYVTHKTINIQARFPRPKHKTEKAVTRDIAGRRLRTRNFHSKPPEVIHARSAKRYSRTARDKATPHANEFGNFRNFSSVKTQRWPQPKKRIKPRSVSGQISRSRPSGRFINNPHPVPSSSEVPSSNRRVLSRLSTLKGPQSHGTRKVVTPRSRSRSYISNKTINVWARFPRPKRKSERAITTDIAGKPLRTRNYHSTPQEIQNAQFKPYFGRKRRVDDRAYHGPSGGYASATHGPRAWIGDIARRAIRGTKKPRMNYPVGIQSGGYRSRTGEGGKVRTGIGYRSRTRPGETRPGQRLPVKQPGFGADLLRYATGKLKGKRTISGGGSVSRGWNNNGNAVSVRSPGRGARGIGDYRGHLRSGRPIKGGGSVSGKVWNNSNRAIITKVPPRKSMEINGYPGKMRRFQDGQPGFSDQGEEFTGTLKASRPSKDAKGVKFAGNLKGSKPQKGGGSISGRTWNNDRLPIAVRTPGQRAFEMRGFSGNIKAKRPVKGGGSVSGKLWNNNRTPIEVRIPGRAAFAMRDFSGNIKAKRPVKGGGSVSGKLWNNNRTPIEVRIPGKAAFAMRGYSGNIKASKPLKGGGSVSGKLWNNKEQPIEVRSPGANGQKMQGYSGTLKLSRFKRDYITNKNSNEYALKKARPDKSVFQEGDLQIKVKRSNYVKNKNSNEYALRKLKPTKGVFDEGNLQVKVKQYNYIKNKNASAEASRVREPGKSFGRATDFQGNIKMQKFQLFNSKHLHPDAQFVRTNKNNVDGERDAATNFKLWWARLFRKGETQPSHLKEKERKPRYDKGEQGLWYE